MKKRTRAAFAETGQRDGGIGSADGVDPVSAVSARSQYMVLIGSGTIDEFVLDTGTLDQGNSSAICEVVPT